MNQTRGKVRSPNDEQDESNSQSNADDADDQSILPEFWMGFNSYTEPTDKDLSKTDSDERNESCQHSSVMEPNIIFYQQPSQTNQSKLTKVLDDLTFTDDSSSSPRLLPKVSLDKLDSESMKPEVCQPEVKPKEKTFKSPKVIRPMLGKRPRPVDDELSSLFSSSMQKNLSS